MKRLLLILPFMLTGCLTIPEVPKFPKPASEEVMQACPNLKLAKTDSDKLTDLMDTIAENYKEYYECRDKVDTWIQWYKKQKENYEKVGKL